LLRSNMNRALAGLLLFLLPLPLVSCYSAGANTARGAFDEARDWWKEEGRELAGNGAREVAAAAVEAGRAEFQRKIEEARAQLGAEWQARMAALDQRVRDGTAKPWEIALWVLLGGAGGGTTGKMVERLIIGKRNGGNGNGGNGS